MRNFKIPLALVLMALASCISFDLENRSYRCGADDSLCEAGMRCGASGYCEALVDSDGGASDGAPADADPIEVDATMFDGEICDNGVDDEGDLAVDCADSECTNASCGTGCLCEAGVSAEKACGDGQDNDNDELTDCLDSDCPTCAGALMCCSDGACRLSC